MTLRGEICPEKVDEKVWKRWIDYRKAIKKPLKPASHEAARKKLAGFGADQAEVVEQSIANGWQGLFPLRGKSNGKGGGSSSKRLSAFERSEIALRKWASERGVDDF